MLWIIACSTFLKLYNLMSFKHQNYSYFTGVYLTNSLTFSRLQILLVVELLVTVKPVAHMPVCSTYSMGKESNSKSCLNQQRWKHLQTRKKMAVAVLRLTPPVGNGCSFLKLFFSYVEV